MKPCMVESTIKGGRERPVGGGSIPLQEALAVRVKANRTSALTRQNLQHSKQAGAQSFLRA